MSSQGMSSRSVACFVRTPSSLIAYSGRSVLEKEREKNESYQLFARWSTVNVILTWVTKHLYKTDSCIKWIRFNPRHSLDTFVSRLTLSGRQEIIPVSSMPSYQKQLTACIVTRAKKTAKTLSAFKGKRWNRSRKEKTHLLSVLKPLYHWSSTHATETFWLACADVMAGIRGNHNPHQILVLERDWKLLEGENAECKVDYVQTFQNFFFWGISFFMKWNLSDCPPLKVNIVST